MKNGIRYWRYQTIAWGSVYSPSTSFQGMQFNVISKRMHKIIIIDIWHVNDIFTHTFVNQLTLTYFELTLIEYFSLVRYVSTDSGNGLHRKVAKQLWNTLSSRSMTHICATRPQLREAKVHGNIWNLDRWVITKWPRTSNDFTPDFGL